MKKLYFFLSVISFVLTSCMSRFDYGLSLTEEEQKEAMQGTWKAVAASTYSPVLDNNGEEHIGNDIDLGLESMTVTENDVTVRFTEQVDLYSVDPEISFEPEYVSSSTSFTFPHNVFAIPDLSFASMDADGDGISSYVLLKGDGTARFSLFTKDDVTACRMIVHFDGWFNCYFEFVREK